MTRAGPLLALAVLTLGVGLSAPRSASAQDTSDYQTWSAVLGGANLDHIAPGARFWFDGHTRRGDLGNTVIVRPGLGYQLTPWASAWVGYAWIPVFADESGARVDEQRAWQQVILTHAWMGGQLKAQSRTRLEQRFHETTSEVGHRARQFVRADYRFDGSRWGAVVWDELFWGLNATGFAPEGFDQNRIFVGPALHTFDAMRVEFGYLNATLRRQDLWQVQHALALNFFVSL